MKTRTPFNLAKKKSPEAKSNELFIYDEIGWFGVTAEQFVKDLRAIEGDVDIRINSPGGNVMDGQAIFQAISEHDGTVTAHIDGLAASMASVIPLAADSVVMSQGAFFMIHNPFTIAIGDAADMRKTADVLDLVGDELVKAYHRKTGIDASDLRAYMDDETWFNSEDAVELGFADEMAGDPAVEAHFDLSIFAHAPKELYHSDKALPKDLERILREEGFSRNQARDFVSGGLRAIDNPREAGRQNQREAGDNSATEIVNDSVLRLISNLQST